MRIQDVEPCQVIVHETVMIDRSLIWDGLIRRQICGYKDKLTNKETDLQI